VLGAVLGSARLAAGYSACQRLKTCQGRTEARVGMAHPVRAMFLLYVVFIAIGLAFFIVVGARG